MTKNRFHRVLKYTIFCPRCKWHFWGNDGDYPRERVLNGWKVCPHCTEIDKVHTMLESQNGWIEYPGPKSRLSQK